MGERMLVQAQMLIRKFIKMMGPFSGDVQLSCVV